MEEQTNDDTEQSSEPAKKKKLFNKWQQELLDSPHAKTIIEFAKNLKRKDELKKAEEEGKYYLWLIRAFSLITIIVFILLRAWWERLIGSILQYVFHSGQQSEERILAEWSWWIENEIVNILRFFRILLTDSHAVWNKNTLEILFFEFIFSIFCFVPFQSQ